jgi:hypothetical protein
MDLPEALKFKRLSYEEKYARAIPKGDPLCEHILTRKSK